MGLGRMAKRGSDHSIPSWFCGGGLVSIFRAEAAYHTREGPYPCPVTRIVYQGAPGGLWAWDGWQKGESCGYLKVEDKSAPCPSLAIRLRVSEGQAESGCRFSWEALYAHDGALNLRSGVPVNVHPAADVQSLRPRPFAELVLAQAGVPLNVDLTTSPGAGTPAGNEKREITKRAGGLH